MKKLLLLALLFATPAYADVEPLVSLPSSIEMKQGGIVKWSGDSQKLENLTTVTVAKTNAVESFGDWNALWEGIVIDLGMAYDANTLDTLAVMFGINLGHLDKYLPIAFPMKEYIDVTFYPVGIYIDNVSGGDGDTTISGASGVGIIKFDITF